MDEPEHSEPPSCCGRPPRPDDARSLCAHWLDPDRHLSPSQAAWLDDAAQRVLSIAASRFGISGELRARVVVDATGLHRAGLPPDAGRRAQASSSGRVGLGAHLDGGAAGLRAGSVRMVAHGGDYVGVVELPGGGLNLAASVRAAVARPPNEPLGRLLHLAGVDVAPGEVAWQATPALQTAATAPSVPRWLPVGDAMGFWEPFTGEGIAWALHGAERLAAVLPGLSREWDEHRAASWRRDQRRWLRRLQRRSRAVGYLASRPRLARAAVAALAGVPGLAPLVLPAAPPATGLAVDGGLS